VPSFDATPVCVRIDPVQRAALSEAATRQRKSKSEVLRDALLVHLSPVPEAREAREVLLDRIVAERVRQEALHPNRTCAHPIPAEHKVVVLTEEVGEVARSVLDGDPTEMLAEELVQVAAVALAWLEYLHRQEA
jgi:NTP pyrophosphatase (non-canonical NTP hydrolase)